MLINTQNVLFILIPDMRYTVLKMSTAAHTLVPGFIVLVHYLLDEWPYYHLAVLIEKPWVAVYTFLASLVQ